MPVCQPPAQNFAPPGYGDILLGQWEWYADCNDWYWVGQKRGINFGWVGDWTSGFQQVPKPTGAPQGYQPPQQGAPATPPAQYNYNPYPQPPNTHVVWVKGYGPGGTIICQQLYYPIGVEPTQSCPPPGTQQQSPPPTPGATQPGQTIGQSGGAMATLHPPQGDFGGDFGQPPPPPAYSVIAKKPTYKTEPPPREDQPGQYPGITTGPCKKWHVFLGDTKMPIPANASPEYIAAFADRPLSNLSIVSVNAETCEIQLKESQEEIKGAKGIVKRQEQEAETTKDCCVGGKANLYFLDSGEVRVPTEGGSAPGSLNDFLDQTGKSPVKEWPNISDPKHLGSELIGRPDFAIAMACKVEIVSGLENAGKDYRCDCGWSQKFTIVEANANMLNQMRLFFFGTGITPKVGETYDEPHAKEANKYENRDGVWKMKCGPGPGALLYVVDSVSFRSGAKGKLQFQTSFHSGKDSKKCKKKRAWVDWTLDIDLTSEKSSEWTMSVTKTEKSDE